MKTKLISLVSVILLSIGAIYADKVKIGDLYYNLNDADLTAEVTSSDDYYSGVSNIDIPSSVSYNDKMYSVTSIGYLAFRFCSGLTSVTIPTSVTNIGSYAFNTCRNLTSIDIPNSVTSIDSWAFQGCSGLTSVTIPNGVTFISQGVFSECTGLTSVTIPNSVTNIEASAFSGCYAMTSIDIPNSVTRIARSAFSYCSGLTSITIPSSVTNIGESPFAGCSGLTSISVESGNTMYDSRDNCNALIETATNTLITGCSNTIIPNSVTSIENWAFSNCSSMTDVTIPNSVTSIGKQAFVGCTGLISLTIPSSVISIGVEAFSGCTSLTSVTIPTGVTSIEQRAFYVCSSLTSVSIPSSVTSIEQATFGGCSGLTSVDIPSSVTSIGVTAFSGCTGLTSIDIPSSVTSIGEGAFQMCNGLTSITCEATNAPDLGGDYVFEDVDKSIPLYVPKQSVSLYQSANGWKEFTNIQAIPTQVPLFPGDPGTLTLNLELKAAVMDGEEILGYEPTGGGGYAKGSSVTITAQEIPGYAFVQWSDSITDMQRTIVLEQSMTLTALYSHSMIEIPVAANKWTFICLPPLGDRQYSADMFTYDGLTDVQWGTYNGAKRAAGQSGWETPESFNALQGYIIFSTTAGTLRINAYEDEIRQGESGNTIYAGMIDYASSHAQNANWNFVGNPFSQGYSIAGFAAAGITSPVTVWNGVGYTTYTPGIDSYILNPFEAFFIQKAENGAEGITFSEEYLEGNGGSGSSSSAIEGELSGAFSVAAGRQVHFSRGNLQYQASTDTWRFAENQYDTIGAPNANISPINDGWIDFFGWGTGNNPTNSSTDYHDYSTFVDWGVNAISNGGNEANQWRTLTNDEWGYLFYDRPNASGKYGKATVAGVNGIIILPDDYNGNEINTSRSAWDNNTFSAEDWAAYEADGAVFLPAAGYREGADVSGVGSVGNYWSSTPSSEPSAYNLLLDSNGINPQDAYYRYRGRSVRLVR